MSLTVDANVLIYAANANSKWHVAAKSLIARLPFGSTLLMLQTLGEVSNACRKYLKLTLKDTRALVLGYANSFRVHAAGASDIEAALDLLARHKLSFWDAFLLAAAGQAGCKVLLTADLSDGAKYGGVLVLNPFEPANAAAVDKLLGPVSS